MSSSQIFAAIDALVSIAATAMPSGVDVIDGPLGKQPTRDFLLIGADDPNVPGTVVAAVDATSDWAALGGQTRDEFYTIWCTYTAFSGDPNFTTSRARAGANIGLLENVLRTPSGSSLNGVLSGRVGWSALQITKITQVNSGNGVNVHVVFGVVCRDRI